jgi:hypothetical protein
MVSAELAAGVPALLLVLGAGVGAVGLGVDQVRCVDAARLAARALARGDPVAAATAVAARAAPPGAAVVVVASGAEVTVRVSSTRDVGGWRVVTVSGSATAQREETGSTEVAEPVAAFGTGGRSGAG